MAFINGNGRKISCNGFKNRFAPGGLLHYGQGKWYPGEELPRWRYGCFFRSDGQPLWSRALPTVGSEEIKADLDQGKHFLQVLGQHLGGIDPFIQPAYEDPFYHLWKESTLPPDVDPLKADLKDPLERRRLARLLLQRFLENPWDTSFPLIGMPRPVTSISCLWRLRQKQLFLLPGDSPMGFRLPLDSLEVGPAAPHEPDKERCPFS